MPPPPCRIGLNILRGKFASNLLLHFEFRLHTQNNLLCSDLNMQMFLLELSCLISRAVVLSLIM